MGTLLKSDHGGELSHEDNLLHTLRWWMKLCFGIGLPLSKPSSGFVVKLFIFVLLLCDWTVGLTFSIGMATNAYTIHASSIASHLSTYLLHLNIFALTSGLHVVMVWKLEQVRALIQALNDLITVDKKLRKLLKTATILIFAWVVPTKVAMGFLQGFANITYLGLPQWLCSLIVVLYGAAFMYPIVIGYTITLLITALGYQFTLVKEEMMEAETFASWEKLYQRHIELCKMTGRLQKCLDLPLTILTGCTLAILCISMFYMTAHANIHDFSHNFFFYIIIISEFCTRCACLCVAADYLRIQIIRGFSINVLNLKHLTSLSVAGFCSLGKPLLLTMLAVVMTYFIWLQQMKGSEIGCSTKSS